MSGFPRMDSYGGQLSTTKWMSSSTQITGVPADADRDHKRINNLVKLFFISRDRLRDKFEKLAKVHYKSFGFIKNLSAELVELRNLVSAEALSEISVELSENEPYFENYQEEGFQGVLESTPKGKNDHDTLGRKISDQSTSPKMGFGTNSESIGQAWTSLTGPTLAEAIKKDTRITFGGPDGHRQSNDNLLFNRTPENFPMGQQNSNSNYKLSTNETLEKQTGSNGEKMPQRLLEYSPKESEDLLNELYNESTALKFLENYFEK